MIAMTSAPKTITRVNSDRYERRLPVPTGILVSGIILTPRRPGLPLVCVESALRVDAQEVAVALDEAVYVDPGWQGAQIIAFEVAKEVQPNVRFGGDDLDADILRFAQRAKNRSDSPALGWIGLHYSGTKRGEAVVVRGIDVNAEILDFSFNVDVGNEVGQHVEHVVLNGFGDVGGPAR